MVFVTACQAGSPGGRWKGAIRPEQSPAQRKFPAEILRGGWLGIAAAAAGSTGHAPERSPQSFGPTR